MTTAAFVASVRSQLGVPYAWGGDSPQTGFDCSGLMYWAAGRSGYAIPRTSESQWAALPVSPTPGNGVLVFFDVSSDSQPQPAHVGMCTTPGMMIDAPHTGAVVREEPIFSGVMGYRHIPFPPAPPIPPAPQPSEDDMPPFLVVLDNSFWVVAADLSSRTEVAGPSDGSALSAAGYKTLALSAAQMALIPVAKP